MENRKSVLQTKPSEILTRPLTDNQQIWIYFIAATLIQSTIYMFDFAAGIAVVNEHYHMGYAGWGTLSLFLMYLPSGVFYIIIISRPDLWDEKDGALSTAQWFGYRTAQFFAYPIWVMYRYAKQLFWAVEALTQTDEKERESALHTANQPSQTELYLFLQPFLQAIPQAFLQMYIMLSHYQQDKTMSEMQTLCITSSLLIIANKIVSFLWFESQKPIGRKEPWSPKEPFIFNKTEPTHAELTTTKEMMRFEEAESSTPFLEPRGLPESSSANVMYDSNSDEQENICEKTVVESLYSLPMPKSSAPRRPETSPEPRSVVDLRGETQNFETPKTFQSMPNLDQEYCIYETIPEVKQKIAAESEPDLQQGNEENLNENPDPTSRPDSTNVELPERKKEEVIIGRENDDALAKCVAFMWWLIFVFSRLLAIAACANFQPFAVFGILVIHYIIIEIHLLRRTGFPSIYKVFIQLCLGYVYTFCFIEIRYKVKNILIFYTSFFILMVLENTIMSVSWYAYSDLDGFWYKFVFVLIFISLALSFMPMGIYFAILKPQKVKIMQ